MKNIRAEFEKQLQDALTKNGSINLTTAEGDHVDMILLSEPKGLYCADAADDYEAIKVHAILQCTQTGKVFIFNEDYSTMELNFDFVGSKKELYKHILKEKEKLVMKVSDLKPRVKVTHS